MLFMTRIEVFRKLQCKMQNIINSLTLQACTLHESTAKCPISYIKNIHSIRLKTL